MNRLASMIVLLAVSLSSLGQNLPTSGVPAGPLAAIRGFTQQEYLDMIALCKEEQRRGNEAPMGLLQLLAIGNLDELEAITNMAAAEIRRNDKALAQAQHLAKLAVQLARLSSNATPAPLGQDLRRVQAERADLIKMGSLAFRGDRSALARLSAVSTMLASNRSMSGVKNLFGERSEFLTSDDLDPRHDDLALDSARTIASAMTLREAEFRARYLRDLNARAGQAAASPLVGAAAPPAAPAPQPTTGGPDGFEKSMFALADLALKRNANGDAKMLHLVHLIFLPNVDELPAIMKFAAERIRSDPKDKASILKIGQDAQALADAVKADPAGGALVLDIQRRRFELAAIGALAARGDAQAVRELEIMSTQAYSQPLGRRAVDLFYLFRSKGDFEARAGRQNMDSGRASAALMTGIFTLEDARNSVDAFQGDVLSAVKSVLPFVAAAAGCDAKVRDARTAWEAKNCRRIETTDREGIRVYQLQCGGETFTPPACSAR